MPRHRPPTSGYAKLSQADEEAAYLDDSDDDDDPHRPPRTISTVSAPHYAPIQAQPPSHKSMQANPVDAYPEHQRRPSLGRRRARRRSSSGVDIKAINARLEKWAEEIASKFKIGKTKGKASEEEQLEIKHSVFRPPEGMRPASAETIMSQPYEEQSDRTTKIEFDDAVESVKVAIELGVHPRRISQGSSGSYFARNSDGKVVGVFKPKDEEPYASRNPKWTKWIHRNLFPCFFGRQCLIPNLSYVSEAAAYVLDTRLRTDLVPYTDIVYFSSKSFHHDFWDRSAYYRKGKPLPAKIGSFQIFLKGYKDANLFLRDHPWPDQTNSGFSPEDAPRWRKKPWTEACRPGSANSEEEQEVRSEVQSMSAVDGSDAQGFTWSDGIKQSFREELEKLVILDYIMRNTDRGLDNWMVRVDGRGEAVSIVAQPPKMNGAVNGQPVPIERDQKPRVSPYRRQEDMSAENKARSPSPTGQSISVGAIDNSLSWPWKHPDAWRSFPFGWLFLPVSLIGQPFSQKTRDHFLPLLTSTSWWSETQLALRRVFSQDADFKERMFAKQIAVMKGQAWNVVETLKTPDHGPLELTRRTRVCVCDDEVDIPVAIPLRTASAEMRRRRERAWGQDTEEDEMDIGAANASSSHAAQDLLGSPTDLPNPNRFDLTRAESMSDAGYVHDTGLPPALEGPTVDRRITIQEAENVRSNDGQHSNNKARNRSSFDTGRRRGHQRYASSALNDTDDLEGDLGYAAAEGMEGSRRKVIMERLVTVKSKNPVFTWC